MAAKSRRSSGTAASANQASRPRGSRRRGTALENAILDAAWEELAAVGYPNVTIAAVASRAGTNKATIYRRWPNRIELLGAAIDRRVPRLRPDPADTGNLRDDVIAVLKSVADRCHAAPLIPDPDGQLANYLRRHAIADGLDQMTIVLDRALQRADIKQPLRPATARLPINVLHSELSLTPTPVTDNLIAEIVDQLFLPLTQH